MTIARAFLSRADAADIRCQTDFTHKGTAGRDPVERVTGSLAFDALAGVVLAAAKVWRTMIRKPSGEPAKLAGVLSKSLVALDRQV